jgi:hypothetical protein
LQVRTYVKLFWVVTSGNIMLKLYTIFFPRRACAVQQK